MRAGERAEQQGLPAAEQQGAAREGLGRVPDRDSPAGLRQAGARHQPLRTRQSQATTG